MAGAGSEWAAATKNKEVRTLMTLNDVARRLGFILSPVQEAYRIARRVDGLSPAAARKRARARAGSLAEQQTNAVMHFIRTHAVWSIPDAPIGNGVPLPMGRAIARAVRKALGIPTRGIVSHP